MNVYYIPKSLAREWVPKRTHPDKTRGNPVQMEQIRKKRRDALTSLHRSEAIKKKWQDPVFRAKNLPNVKKNLLQFQECHTEEERKANYEKRLEAVEKLAAAQNHMTGSYVSRFMERNCPDVEIEPDMPLGYYMEMLEFFHPELVFMLENEWKKEFGLE